MGQKISYVYSFIFKDLFPFIFTRSDFFKAFRNKSLLTSYHLFSHILQNENRHLGMKYAISLTNIHDNGK